MNRGRRRMNSRCAHPIRNWYSTRHSIPDCEFLYVQTIDLVFSSFPMLVWFGIGTQYNSSVSVSTSKQTLTVRTDRTLSVAITLCFCSIPVPNRWMAHGSANRWSWTIAHAIQFHLSAVCVCFSHLSATYHLRYLPGSSCRRPFWKTESFLLHPSLPTATTSSLLCNSPSLLPHIKE